MKVKVLHAIGSLSKGGAEFQCRQLANHLDPERYDVSILCFDEGPNPDLAPHVRAIFVDRGSKWNLLSLCRRIDSIIEEERPDVVQAWLPEVISVPAALAARRRGIPVISGHRNTLSYDGELNKAVRDRLRLPQYLVADRIISNFVIDEEPFLFRWLYSRRNGSCIFNGIAVDALRSLQIKELPVRAEYRLIFAGRLAPQKGLPTALRALKLLVDQGYHVHLTLFGEGPAAYEAELYALVDELKIEAYVTFFGQCRDWQAYAGDATALVFPTKGEGTSNVILESLAVGLPVVISDIAMARQLLRNGENALIVASSHPAEWAGSLAAILNDPALREKLSLGSATLAESFSVPGMVEQYDLLYNELLRNL
jgi:glycosyltransferase involved in cell wall biosynthesis